MPGYELIGAEEAQAVSQVFADGGVLFRHGFDGLRNGSYKVAEFEQAFATTMGAIDALAVTSGTAALRVALEALDLTSGARVAMPTFTFVATAEAIIEAGYLPVCVDIDETLNMDVGALANVLREGVDAVIVVHMLGTPALMPEIVELCAKASVPLLEDAAWGCGGSLLDRPLGTWGRMGCFSFDFAKTMTTGEGGMILFSNFDDALRARAWHDHGHENDPGVPRWEDTRRSSGFNFRMTELQGAVGLAQLRKLPTIVEAQRSAHARMVEALEDLPGVELRPEPPGSYATCDALIFSLPTARAALNCRAALLDAGGSTKILPEAVTWHFAAHWDHMESLVSQHPDGLRSAFDYSEERLGRSVAIPVSAVGSGLSDAALRAAILDGLSRA